MFVSKMLVDDNGCQNLSKEFIKVLSKSTFPHSRRWYPSRRPDSLILILSTHVKPFSLQRSPSKNLIFNLFVQEIVLFEDD